MLARLQTRLSRALTRAAIYLDPGRGRPADQSSHQPAFDVETHVLWDQVKSHTMTSIERIDALRLAIEYINANAIPGDIVECGVWRGGSIKAVALTLLRLGDARRLWLYDTFSGMTPPGPDDIDFRGRPAAKLMATEEP